MVEERLSEFERRVSSMEEDIKKMKVDIHTAKNEAMKMQNSIRRVNANTEEILRFVKGARKIAGITTKHWKTALVFGAGLMTSAGVGNPNVWRFVTQFFG